MDQTLTKRLALGQGMPSHFHTDESDVKVLNMKDSEDFPSNKTLGNEGEPSFYNLIKLTMILDEIVRTYFTVRGMESTAYIISQMILIRALLRPLNSWLIVGTDRNQIRDFDAAQAVLTGAIACSKDLVEFIESLTAANWDAFWHSCK